MAKLINKSKCTFEVGVIVKKGKQIGIPFPVWAQLNKLELVLQQYDYLISQPKYQPGPSLDGFERKSDLKTERPYVETPETPVTDKRVAEAMQFMAEVDAINDAVEINEKIDEYGELVDWCNSDKFIEGRCYNVIDTPMLGDPLHLKAEDVAETIGMIVKSPIVMAEE